MSDDLVNERLHEHAKPQRSVETATGTRLTLTDSEESP